MGFSIIWRKYFILCALLFLGFGTYAQQNHFIYLQTENNQLFYVKMNGKVISSSSAGYLILPDLPDGTLQLTVGFPKNEFPEEKFDVGINNKNEGYLLKNLNEKGWVLFNLQSLAIIERSSIASSVAAVVTTNKNDDAFSSLLANAVNDSSLFQHNNVENKIQTQTTPPDQIIVKDTALSQKDNDRNASQIQDVQITSINNDNGLKDTLSHKIDAAPAVSTTPVEGMKGDTLRIYDTVFVKDKDEVNKILGVKDSVGMDMVYTVKKPSGEDTVRLFLPSTEVNKAQKPDSLISMNNTIAKSNDAVLTITPTIIPPDYKASEQAPSKDSVIQIPENPVIPKTDSSSENKQPMPPLIEKKVEDSISETRTDVPKPESEIIVLPQAVTSSEMNSDCSSFATDQDFLKVRKKMASSIGKENMIEAARKFFKLKCYSTEQIKNLSYLFLTEEGKYLFFDMAYAFTSDSNLYETLQSQFQDPYYLNRFKAMIRK